MTLLQISQMGATLIAGIGIFLAITLLLVIVLLVAKRYLVSTGKVTVTINDDKKVEVETGGPLLSALATQNVFLPSACGGKGSCGQCRVRVTQGGGEILPTEAVHFTRKEIKDDWRLACQVKVKNDLSIKVPASVLDIKEYECTVVSNKNVATFIKEFIVALPPDEHMDFIPGSYAQIKIPPFHIDYDKDIDKSQSARNICRHGRSSASSASSVSTPRPLSARTPWPTIPPRATASCSPCASPHLPSSPNLKWDSWTSTRVSHRRISSPSSPAIRCS